MRDGESIVFAWWPVWLYEVRADGHWHPTGIRAWLCPVRRVVTFWREVYHTELRR